MSHDKLKRVNGDTSTALRFAGLVIAYKKFLWDVKRPSQHSSPPPLPTERECLILTDTIMRSSSSLANDPSKPFVDFIAGKNNNSEYNDKTNNDILTSILRGVKSIHVFVRNFIVNAVQSILDIFHSRFWVSPTYDYSRNIPVVLGVDILLHKSLAMFVKQIKSLSGFDVV